MGWKDPRGSSPGGLHWLHLHTGILPLLLFVCMWSRRGSLCPSLLKDAASGSRGRNSGASRISFLE